MCVQRVSSVQVKDGEIVQLEKQLTDNVRSHQDAVFEKEKELSTLQAQLDRVCCLSVCLFVCVLTCLKNHFSSSAKFLWPRLSSPLATVQYIVYFLWMPSCFHIMGPMEQNQRQCCIL